MQQCMPLLSRMLLLLLLLHRAYLTRPG